MVKLLSGGSIDTDRGYRCTYFRGPERKCEAHRHTFFEFVITGNENVIHEINGKKTRLKKGTLMLIRPDDVHLFADEGQGEFFYFNLAFTRDTFDNAAIWLNAEDEFKHLEESADVPTVILTDSQAQSLINQFFNLMGEGTVSNPVAYARGIISYVFSKYFLNTFTHSGDDDVPQWLVSLCNELHKKENFSGGLEKMSELSGMSYSYIGHSFKKYLDMTPSEYINTIRMDYAGLMLVSTNMSILDISLECGFENLGYFYKIFKNYHSVSPAQYKKIYQKKTIG